MLVLPVMKKMSYVQKGRMGTITFLITLLDDDNEEVQYRS